MCLFLGGIYHSTFALTSSTQGEYPDDTIITAENLVDVLDSLGVSHGKVIYTNSTKSLKFTVGELKSELLSLHTDSGSSILKRGLNDEKEGALSVSQSLADYSQMQPFAKGKVKFKRLSNTFHHSGYDLTHSVGVKYLKKSFVDVTSTDISIDSDFTILTYKIAKKRKITASFSKSKVTQKYNIDVGVYVGVKGALVRINTITHDGAAYFYAKNEL